MLFSGLRLHFFMWPCSFSKPCVGGTIKNCFEAIFHFEMINWIFSVNIATSLYDSLTVCLQSPLEKATLDELWDLWRSQQWIWVLQSPVTWRHAVWKVSTYLRLWSYYMEFVNHSERVICDCLRDIGSCYLNITIRVNQYTKLRDSTL
jgi:hypothetical protein